MFNVVLGPTLLRDQELTHVRVLLARWFSLQNKEDNHAVSLAVEICKILQEKKSFVLLDSFLDALPLDNSYVENEQIVRAKISVAFQKKDFQLLFHLIESNEFENGEDLIDIWDNAHYAKELERTRKPLTPLGRFRVRQRYPPPRSICPARKRKRFTLTQTSRNILQQWLEENKSYPYPSKETEEYLSKRANLTLKQVKTWFANTRRRLRHAHERTEGHHLLRQKYKRKKENKKCRKTLSCPSLRSDGKSSQDCTIIKEPPSGKEDSSVLPIDQDKEYLADSTASVSSDSQVISRQSPDDLFTSPCNPQEECNARPRSSFNSSYENSTCKQAPRGLTDIPPFQLVEPLVVANPCLFWPTLLTCHNNYSDSAVNLQCTSKDSVNTPCSKPPSYSQEFDGNHRKIADILPWKLLPIFPVLSLPYQPNISLNNKDVSSNMSGKTSPIGLCLIPSPASSGQLMRLHAASALLDLSLKSRMLEM